MKNSALNVLICATTLPSHGRGHKFETCTAHQKYLQILQVYSCQGSLRFVRQSSRRLLLGYFGLNQLGEHGRPSLE